MELTVCDVALEVASLAVADVDADPDDAFDFRLATRCAVAAGRADICIGGRGTGSVFFGVGWAEESV